MTDGPIANSNTNLPDAEAIHENKSATPRLPSVSTEEYQTLLRLARALHRRCPSWTLNPTALAHDALIKVHAWPNLPSSDDPRFFALAARAMRQLLVDAARRKLYAKHGGGLKFVPLTEGAGKVAFSPVEFLDLNRALDELAELNSRHALAVELTEFFGHTLENAAAILRVAPKTVQRDLRTAHAWLACRIRGGGVK